MKKTSKNLQRVLAVMLAIVMTVSVAVPAVKAKAAGYSNNGNYSLDDSLSFGSNADKVWKPSNHLTNFKLDADNITVGIPTTLAIWFDYDVMPTATEAEYRKGIRIDISGPEYGTYVNDFLGDDLTKNGKLYSTISDIVFSEAGRYTLEVYECNKYGNVDVFSPELIASTTFTVKALTDENGNRIKNSISVAKDSYKPDEKSAVTLSYTVENPSHDYNIYILDPDAGSNDYNWYKIIDIYSIDGSFDIAAGKTCKKTINYSFNKKGIYRVCLFDCTIYDKVAETSFIVMNDIGLNVDTSKLEKGQMPFYSSFKKDKTHLSLDTDDSIEISVQLPFNYDQIMKDVMQELKMSDYEKDIDIDMDKTQPTTVTLKYQPAGSKSSRQLDQKVIYGYLDMHKFKYTSEKILELISGYMTGDSAFAGIVTLEFENLGDGGLYFGRFKDSVSFSVAKEPGIKKAKAVSKTVTLAYGESAGIYVEDNLGGEIVAEIYKGKKKIRTVTQNCTLDRVNGIAYGTVLWDLGNSSNKYVSAGEYTVKVYTQTKLTLINNGKKETTTLKSKIKSFTIKLEKPSGSLKLSSNATGLNGGEYATYENPLIGIKNTVSIGSKISLKIKNSKGTVILNDTYAQAAGTYTAWYDLSKLDSNLAIGKYTATVTAETLEGKKVTKDIKFSVEKSPKVQITAASVSVKDGVGAVSVKTSQSSDVSVQVKNSKGSVVATVIDGQYAAGTINASFTCGSYAVGSYSVVITAKNSGGTSSSTKTFSIQKKPVVVKKPTVSALSVRFTQKNSEDAYKFAANYTAKGAKLVMEVMWNDAEQIVAVKEITTQKDSGSVEWVWDGYKSNGFRASAGSYTLRVYAVNSAGKTDYLRQNFTISEG
ncbi:MAG: hypothetical protein MJ131_10290 [Lachnospiraceae bacterium]|nr:hypothetical protein [Lachnospiraceae bacterium]